MKQFLLLYTLLIAFQPIFAQPGYVPIYGNLNDIDDQTIRKCADDKEFQLKELIIDSTTNLCRLGLLKDFKSLSVTLHIPFPKEFNKIKFTNLTELHLTFKTHKAAISAFKNFISLQQLSLSNYPEKKLPSSLSDLKSLVSLFVDGESLTDADAVASSKNLRKLSLRSPGLTALPDFKTGNKIEHLILSGFSPDPDLSNIGKLHHLTIFETSNVNFTSLPREKMPSLTTVFISENNLLKEISNLESYPNLKNIFILRSSIRKFEILSVSGVQEIILNDNNQLESFTCKGCRQIDKITLEELPALHRADISGILPEALTISHTGIKEIIGRDNLHDIPYVIITNNEYLKIKPEKKAWNWMIYNNGL